MTCQCFARCEADCICDHDWTPPAVVALRAEAERLRAALKAIKTHCEGMQPHSTIWLIAHRAIALNEALAAKEE